MSRITLLALILALALPALAQEPAAKEPQLTKHGLGVAEAAFGTEVVDRDLQGQADTFQIGDRVYCWTRIMGGKPGDVIRHVWLFDGREIQAIDLHVEDAHWRTWSYKTMFPGMAGDWKVEIQTAAGVVMASYGFTAAD